MREFPIYVSELIERRELRELVQRLDVGIELIRFSISDNLDELEKNLEEGAKDLRYWGNPPCTFHGPFLDLNPMCYDSRVRRVTMDRFNECYAAARELGAQKIVYHSCIVPTVYYLQGWADRMVEFWNEFLQDKSGIPVVMENVLDREIYPFVDVVNGVDHPDFGICLDVGHAHCYSEHEVVEWSDALGASIRHLHVHDNKGDRDSHLRIGQGSVDYSGVLASIARNAASDLSFTIECPSKDAVIESHAKLQEMIKMANLR